MFVIIQLYFGIHEDSRGDTIGGESDGDTAAGWD